jgi:hypothetical protein
MEKLLHFDRTGVAAVAEQAARNVADQQRRRGQSGPNQRPFRARPG